MASGLYAKYKQTLLGGGTRIDLTTDDIRAIMVDVADYAVNLATHDFLDDIPGAARVAVSGALSGKTVTDGAFNATDTSFTSVTGDGTEALVLYKHTGVDSTSPLIAYFDNAGVVFTPNGNNVTLDFPVPIFSL